MTATATTEPVDTGGEDTAAGTAGAGEAVTFEPGRLISEGAERAVWRNLEVVNAVVHGAADREARVGFEPYATQLAIRPRS